MSGNLTVLSCTPLPNRTAQDPPTIFIHLVNGFLHRTVNSEIDHGVGERAAHVILHGKVIAPLKERIKGHILNPLHPDPQLLLVPPRGETAGHSLTLGSWS